MTKKNIWISTIIIILILAIGGYLIFHKSYKTPTSYSTTNTSTNTATIVQTKTVSGIGQYLADSRGNALYTYSADTSGVSNCNGSCVYSWPIYSPTDSSTTLPTNVTIISRSDGSKQYAYKGMPLYTFTSDSSGQVTGNGVSGFYVAKP
ncbi:MAG TPA: hypothetical protein VII94_00385 [Candidatus Saccharimonadales bacterium]